MEIHYAVQRFVTFAAHNNEQDHFCSEINIKSVQIGYNDSIKELENKFMGMKFDVIVGNPPYKAGLHMKFLEKSFDNLADEGNLIFIQPSDHFITLRREKSKLVHRLFKYSREIELVNGNSLFKDAKFFVPLMIIHLKKENRILPVNVIYPDKTVIQFNDPDLINIWGNMSGSIEFFQKIINENSILDYACWTRGGDKTSISDDGFIIWFSGIRGNVTTDPTKIYADNFFTLVSKDKNRHIFKSDKFKKLNKGSGYAFFFRTEEEANNFYFYLQTNFVRTALSFVKLDQNLNLTLIPWKDFSKIHNDESLQRDLTIEEKTFLDKMPAYYEI